MDDVTPTETDVRSWHTPAKVAEMLGISERTVLRMAEEGKLRALRIGAGKTPPFKIDPESVRKLLEP